MPPEPITDPFATRWVKLETDDKLPVNTIIILWCGLGWLSAPCSFSTQREADTYHRTNKTTCYLVIPDPRKL